MEIDEEEICWKGCISLEIKCGLQTIKNRIYTPGNEINNVAAILDNFSQKEGLKEKEIK